MNIWILNHYATNQYFDAGGRHHWFAKYLVREGHSVEIFCSSYFNYSVNISIPPKQLYEEKIGSDNVKYTFIKTMPYKGNGIARIKNMISFYANVKKVCKAKIKKGEKPDVILASSVHPLTLIAGIKIGKKYNIPCICEIRDLWPMTLVEFGMLKENGIITKLMYYGEKCIYKRAKAIIFTFVDGYKYIIDKGWDRTIKLEKIFYINNGIDLEDYEYKVHNYSFIDKDLESNKFKVVYTGSIGEPNQVNKIIDAAEIIQRKGYDNITFILYGDGILKRKFEEDCNERKIRNVIFKGIIEKQKIPYVLSKSNLNIYTMKDLSLYKYGISPNKIFDYLSSGKPLLSSSEAINSITHGAICSIIDKDLVDGIINVYNMDEKEYIDICNSARNIIREYDFKVQTCKLFQIINRVVNEK